MDLLKEKIDSYIQLVISIEENIKNTKNRNINLIKNKFKSIVKLEIDIVTSLENINVDSIENKQRKLLFNRLKDAYNQAHDEYESLNKEFEEILLEDHQKKFDPSLNGENIKEDNNENHSGLLRKLDYLEEQEFNLEKLRKNQLQVKEIEEAIDNSSKIFNTLQQLTHEQGKTIDNIENNIESTYINIQQGSDCLKKAKEFHTAAIKKVLPIAGAAVAAGVTGPVGLIYGFKIGTAATIGLSSVFGFIGGRALSKKLDLPRIKNE